MESIVRLVIYGILLLINGLMYYFLHSHFYFMLMVIMVVAPFLSVLMAVVIRKYIDVTVEPAINSAGSEYGRQNDRVYFFIKITNPSFLVSLDTIINIEIKNTLFETSGRHRISMPVHMRKGSQIELPVIPSLPGIINVSVDKIYIKDLMSFIRLKKKIFADADVTVLPEII